MAASGAAQGLDRRGRVLLAGIHCVGGAQFLGHRELFIEQVDRDDLRAGDQRVLQRQVAEPTDAEDGDQVAFGYHPALQA